MRRLAVTALLCTFGASVLVGTASSENRERHKRELSAFGEYAVRFQPGTSLQDMTKVVKKAGGTVIEDMHEIAAMEVASTDSTLLAKLPASPLVVAAFVDGVGPSASASSAARAVRPRKRRHADGFDPWHGQYQWDDKRMDVPAPSAQTSGSGREGRRPRQRHPVGSQGDREELRRARRTSSPATRWQESSARTRCGSSWASVTATTRTTTATAPGSRPGSPVR